MPKLFKGVLAASLLILPLLGGGFRFEIGNPAANPEARDRDAVILVRIATCNSPARAQVIASAEGLVNGERRSVTLKVFSLSTPGTYGVIREWLGQGTWVVKLVATPEGWNFTPAALVRVNGDSFDWAGIRRYTHEPTSEDVASMLDTKTVATAQP